MDMAAILVMWFKPFKLTSILWKRHMKFVVDRPSGYWEKKSLKILNMMSDLNHGYRMTLTFGTHKASFAHLLDYTFQLWYHRLQIIAIVSEKSIVLTFPIQKYRGPNLTLP